MDKRKVLYVEQSWMEAVVTGSAGLTKISRNSPFEFLDKSKAGKKFSEQLLHLQAGIQSQSEREIYDARAEICQIFKAIVLKLTIASAGASPPRSRSDARIRRDHPKRYFTAIFSDGSLRTGWPASSPVVPSVRKFSRTDLSKSLGLSPPQGTLTALLAEGESLTLRQKKWT
jgi:hypothetical protein